MQIVEECRQEPCPINHRPDFMAIIATDRLTTNGRFYVLRVVAMETWAYTPIRRYCASVCLVLGITRLLIGQIAFDLSHRPPSVNAYNRIGLVACSVD